MDINIRKYKGNNLLVVDIVGNKGELKNIIVIAYSDSKKNIILKKAMFEDKFIFPDRIDYNILDICKKIADTYGENGDIEKLWIADRIFDVITHNS